MPIGFPYPYLRPISAVLFRRYNIDVPASPSNDAGLNYGPDPLLVPRLWNMGLGSRAGLDQWASMATNNSRLPLPPFPMYPTRRGDPRSMSLAFNKFNSQAANSYGYIPATFIGWTPQSGGMVR